jgi:hypothetical protein
MVKHVYLANYHNWIMSRMSEAKESVVRALHSQKTFANMPVFDSEDCRWKSKETERTQSDLHAAEEKLHWLQRQIQAMLVQESMQAFFSNSTSDLEESEFNESTRRAYAVLTQTSRDGSRGIRDEVPFVCLRYSTDVTLLADYVSVVDASVCVLRVTYTLGNILEAEMVSVEDAIKCFYLRVLNSLVDGDDVEPEFSPFFTSSPTMSPRTLFERMLNLGVESAPAKLLICIEGIQFLMNHDENEWSQTPEAIRRWKRELFMVSRASRPNWIRTVFCDLGRVNFLPPGDESDVPCRMM